MHTPILQQFMELLSENREKLTHSMHLWVVEECWFGFGCLSLRLWMRRLWEPVVRADKCQQCCPLWIGSFESPPLRCISAACILSSIMYVTSFVSFATNADCVSLPSLFFPPSVSALSSELLRTLPVCIVALISCYSRLFPRSCWFHALSQFTLFFVSKLLITLYFNC